MDLVQVEGGLLVVVGELVEGGVLVVAGVLAEAGVQVEARVLVKAEDPAAWVPRYLAGLLQCPRPLQLQCRPGAHQHLPRQGSARHPQLSLRD